MKQNAIGWFDIYVEDMHRAVNFYQPVLKQELEDMVDPTDDGVTMKSFAADMGTYGAGGALIKRQGSAPGIGGTLIYFGVADCSIEEARVAGAGGTVINPKMSIGEFGWVSICMDTEGNMFGLSSMK